MPMHELSILGGGWVNARVADEQSCCGGTSGGRDKELQVVLMVSFVLECYIRDSTSGGGPILDI